MGTPVLRADTRQAERELEAIPWVEDARVTTDFPTRLSIEIRERTPLVAIAGPDGRAGCSTATAGCSTCSTANRSHSC